jgi:hypothetical protein
MLIGSATRGTFTTQQLAEFNTFKTFLRELWSTIQGVIGFIDLEDDPAFGDDGAMIVTAPPNGNQVTVNALTANAAMGNRIRWAGMPYNVAADTGGQTIAGVSGNTITLSGLATGLQVGSIIRAINPAPWVAHPECWLRDHQHFQAVGYQRQAAREAQWLLDNGVLSL